MDFDSLKQWYRREVGKTGTLILVVILALMIFLLYYIFFVDSSDQLSSYILQIPDKSQEHHSHLTTPYA